MWAVIQAGCDYSEPSERAGDPYWLRLGRYSHNFGVVSNFICIHRIAAMAFLLVLVYVSIDSRVKCADGDSTASQVKTAIFWVSHGIKINVLLGVDGCVRVL